MAAMSSEEAISGATVIYGEWETGERVQGGGRGTGEVDGQSLVGNVRFRWRQFVTGL